MLGSSTSLRLLPWALAALFLLPLEARAGTHWGTDGAVVSTATDNQFLLSGGHWQVAPDSSGGVYVVWTDSRNRVSTGTDIYGVHLDSSGAVASGWTPNGNVICNAAGEQSTPLIAPDGAGGFVVTWKDYRGGDSDLYAQRFNAGGAALWTANGVLILNGPTAGQEQLGAPFLSDTNELFVLMVDSAPLPGGWNWRSQKLSLADGSRQLGTYGIWLSSTGVVPRVDPTALNPAELHPGNIVTDGAGGFLVSWGDQRAGDGFLDAFAMRVNSNGTKAWEITLSSGIGDQGFATQNAPDGSGGLFAVWSDSRSGVFNIYGTHVNGSGAPVGSWTIGNLGGIGIAVSTWTQQLPSVANYNGDMIAGWTDAENSAYNRTYAQRLGASNAAKAWTARGVLLAPPGSGNIASSVTNPVQLEVNGDNIFAAWGQLVTDFVISPPSVNYDENMIGQALDPAGTLLFGSTGAYIGEGYIGAPTGNAVYRATLSIPTSTGAVIYVWQRGQDGGLDIAAQRVSTAASTGGAGGGGGGGELNAGAWAIGGASVTAETASQFIGHGGHQSDPDGSGGVFVVWTDSRNVATTGLDIYLTRLDANGNTAAGWTAGGTPICTAAGDQKGPIVHADGAGGAYVTWQDFRNGNQDGYAQRVNGSGVAQWAADGVVAADGPTAGGVQLALPFKSDDGGYFIVFYDSAPLAQGGLNWRVQKLNSATGARLYATEGKWISSNTVQSYCGLGGDSDGNNGFILLLGDARNGDCDARAARVDSNGDKAWEVTLSSGLGDQGFMIQGVSDGAGGIYAVWVDTRSGNYDIYATRITNSGAAASGWTIGDLGGKPVSVAAGWQWQPTVGRFNGDLVASWVDMRGGLTVATVYAQRMAAATGSPVWTTDGVLVATAPVGGGVTDTIAPHAMRVSDVNIHFAWYHKNVSAGCGSVCTTIKVRANSLDGDGATLFSSTGAYLGDAFSGNTGSPVLGIQSSSAPAGAAIFVWSKGQTITNTMDIMANKFDAADLAGGGGGGGGGGASTTTLAAYFAVVSSDTIIAQWKNVPGNNYVAVLSTESSFASVLSSTTVSDTFRSTYTALSQSKTHYFKVKIATEADTAYGAAVSANTGAAGDGGPPAFSIKWGSNGAGDGQFKSPVGIDVDAAGNVYVADTQNHRIQKFDANGNFLTKWPSGTSSGTANGEFYNPYDVAVDASGNVYVAEQSGARVQKFDSTGTFLAKWGSLGSGNGQFIGLAGIAVDSSGNVYTAEQSNNRVQKFDSSGAFLAKWGSLGNDDGKFNGPWGIDVDPAGNVVVVDATNLSSPVTDRVQKFSATGAFIRKWGARGSASGLFINPRQLAVDSSSNVYVAELSNARVTKYSPEGVLLAAWGGSGSGDGKFLSLSGLTVDSAGNVYTVEAGNHRVQRFGAAGITAAPTGVQFTAVSSGSLNASWDLSTGNSYVIALSTQASFASVISSGTGPLNQNTTAYADLGTDATYYFKVKISTHADTAYSTAISTYLAPPPPPPAPTSVQFTAVYGTTVSVSWALSAGNAYVMVLSTTANFNTVLSSATGALDQNTTGYTGLVMDATYYFKVKVSTHPDASYAAAISTYLPPPRPPAGVAFSNVAFPSLSASWTLESGNSYVMALSKVANFATTVSSGTGALDQNTTSYAGLEAEATYYFRVKISTHPDLSYSAAISAKVPAPAPPGNVRFTAVSTTSLTAAWDALAGNTYTMVLSSVSSFATTLSSGVSALGQGSTTYAVTGGAFYFKVKVSSHPDVSYSAAIATASAAQPGSSTTQPVSTTVDTTININPITGPVAVTVPAGAFGGANNVTATVPIAVPAASFGGGSAVTPLGPAIQLDLATPVAQFSKAVDIAITIPPPADPTNIYLAWYDEVLKAWWPLWASYYNALLQQVVGQTWHFSTFAAVRVTASTTLDDLRVFPNPVNFSGAARGTVKFMGLTADPTIRIYTITGELVKTLNPGTRVGANVNDGTSGLAEWDGRNEAGQAVARGTYLFVVRDTKGSSKSGRIGVKR